MLYMGSDHDHHRLLFVELCILYLVAIASTCYGDDAYKCSRATYYGSPDCLGNPRGACGFGEYGRTANKGVVAGVSRLYRNGTGCGACYQVKCKIAGLCSTDGTVVVVTDYGEGHYTDFVVSSGGYATLAASPSVAADLFAYGVVDVDYRRVPCSYGGSNVALKVHEHSSFPSYLAILPMYVSGAYDVSAVQVWVDECREWRGMRKVYGAVWDLENPPSFSRMRMQLTADDGSSKWVDLPSGVPAYWRPGVAYDTGFQI